MRSSADATSNRRHFLAGASALGAAPWLGTSSGAAADPPPEITSIRLVRNVAICLAPQYIAEELLTLEGFTDVQYVEVKAGTNVPLIATGQADFTQEAAPALVYAMDSHSNLVALTGIHAGCYELSRNDKVHAIRDLKGKTVAVYALGGGDHILLSSMLAYVGMDPRKDVKWLAEKTGDAMQFFIDGKADAFMGFAPQPLQLRAKKIGHVIINTAQELNALPYNRWRESNPEDTLRFHALRLHEVGMIKASPQKLIAQGTDWRFLNELKKELKA